ncbi:maleylpyruvate isomerase family mycothiol-dependent enzyme [Nocardioides sp. C4-1]|uniref:maleylpyruvate isomerase family mycothiol-dependent enzyme n=1 Tax=Nocardioides sp. C4-1 TaxID=3151851 RepID=UPI003263B500
MRPPAVNAAVRAERAALADLASGFTEEQWATPSLCEAWTVRHVVAHLTTTTHTRPTSLIGHAVRARGSFDRMEVQVAQRLVDRHTDAELVALLRESATSDRRIPLSGPMDPLMDVVVHAQDLARPLGLTHRTPDDVTAAVLDHLAGNRLMGGPRRVRGLRLVAASGWTTGEGPVVSGPDVDLLLAVAGRPAGLAALGGAGLPTLAARLTPAG